MHLESPLLRAHGFVHAFSTRLGGVSRGPFTSMNLARAVGDDPSDVAENYRRFAAVLGVEPEALHESNQVHGDGVLTVDGGRPASADWATPADALVSVAPGHAVGVRTADCVPLLVGDPRSGCAAAIHAGWRGVACDVVGATFRVLAARGVAARDCVVAIGPHIGLGAFEVGDEVVEALAPHARGRVFADRSRPKPHVDLEVVLRAQLEAAGVEPGRVERVPGCTFTEEARFHSFRRDGKASGRQLAAIVHGHPPR